MKRPKNLPDPRIKLGELHNQVIYRDENLRIGQILYNVLKDRQIKGMELCTTSIWDPYYMVNTLVEYNMWISKHATIINDEIVAVHP